MSDESTLVINQTINKTFLIPNTMTSKKSRVAIFERKSIFPLLEVKDEMAEQYTKIDKILQ